VTGGLARLASALRKGAAFLPATLLFLAGLSTPLIIELPRWQKFYTGHAHYVVWAILAALLLAGLPALWRSRRSFTWRFALLLLLCGLTLRLCLPGWRLLSDDAVLASTTTALSTTGELCSPGTRMEFDRNGDYVGGEWIPAKRPAGLPAMATLIDRIHHTPMATVWVNSALLVALFTILWARFGPSLHTFLALSLMLAVPTIREPFLSGGMEPLFITCLTCAFLALQSERLRNAGMLAAMLGCMSRYEAFIFLAPAMVLLAGRTWRRWLLLPTGLIAGAQWAVYKSAISFETAKPPSFGLSNLSANIRSWAFVLRHGFDWTPFGWGTILLLAIASYLVLRQKIWRRIGAPGTTLICLPILFFAAVSLLYSWPLYNCSMWRFFILLSFPLVLSLFYLRVNVLLLAILAALQTQNMGWTERSASRFYALGIDAVMGQVEAVRTPDTNFPVPYRKSAYSFATPGKESLPAFNIFVVYEGKELALWDVLPPQKWASRTRVLEQNGGFTNVYNEGLASKILVDLWQPAK